MELNLEGKTAVITGGSRGIGKAIKEELEKEGVYCIDVSRSTGYDLMGEGLKKALDLMSVEILINNVGGCGTSDNWKLQMDKNYGIMAMLTLEYLKHKRTWGRVITIASIYGKEKGNNPGFTASKAAEIAFMKCLAGQYEGITFNTVSPGYIEVGKHQKEKGGNPEDVAKVVTFLCSDQARYINGENIVIDGGESHSF